MGIYILRCAASPVFLLSLFRDRSLQTSFGKAGDDRNDKNNVFAVVNKAFL